MSAVLIEGFVQEEGSAQNTLSFIMDEHIPCDSQANGVGPAIRYAPAGPAGCDRCETSAGDTFGGNSPAGGGNGCQYRRRCAIERLACSAFSRYVRCGEVTPFKVGEVPTSMRYRQIFERKEREDATF